MKFNIGERVIVSLGSFDSLSAKVVKYNYGVNQWVIRIEGDGRDCLVAESAMRREYSSIITMIDDMMAL